MLRHFVTFATTVLDRVYLLNEDCLDGGKSRFDVAIRNEAVVTEILARGQGCLLLGAHHGSFEVLRLVGRSQPDLRVSLAMFEATGRRIGAALNAINPHLAPHLIGLGTPSAMLEMRDCLAGGGFVGMLADRTLPETGDTSVAVRFLGAPAAFPTGPAAAGRPAASAGRADDGPVPRRQPLRDHVSSFSPTRARTAGLVERYVARLEHYCREAPYNWFNFYDFWA